MSLKIFKHESRGHYIGCCIVVVAGTMKKAESLIRQQLDNHGLEGEELNITKHEIVSGNIIYVDDGNY